MNNQIEDKSPIKECVDPIFIFGIMQRSGTNFVKDVVCLHPDCGFPGPPLVEDFLAQNTDLLVQYSQAVLDDWNRLGRTTVYDSLEEELRICLGNGVLSLLESRIKDKKRLVTKTPSIRNLEHFFKIFPKARLLIVVRDGRAVVESGVKSFGWSYEQAFHQWAEAAKKIYEFDCTYKVSNHKYLIVRYEDIWENLEEKIENILRFLDLDCNTYDLKSAKNLPVRGSSTIRSQSDEKMVWKAVEKPKEFNPLDRWRNWDSKLHQRFNWLAGQYMEYLGYQRVDTSSSLLSSGLWKAWNIGLDFKWKIILKAKKIYQKLKYCAKNINKNVYDDFR